MAQPVWVTDAGTLGTIAEGLFFQIDINATDPDGDDVEYSLVAGSLPTGIQLLTNGQISGVPTAVSTVQGVPTEVSEDVTSQFAVRATSVGGRINERTFSITVTGQDAPEFTTPAGRLGSFFSGTVFGPNKTVLQIAWTDSDPGETITVSIESGELPPGLTLNQDGTFTGYIDNTDPLPGSAVPGFDVVNNLFDEFPFDFPARQINRAYEFVVGLSDGKTTSLRTFDIFVTTIFSLSADTMQITADDNVLTSDLMNVPIPLISNYPSDGNIGTYRHDNFFAYQIIGYDLEGDAVEFDLELADSGDLPPNLSFDINTGWLTGYFTDVGATETTYNFSVRVYKRDDPSIISTSYPYSMTVIGDIESTVTWTTGTKLSGLDVYTLGNIANGAVSTLYVEAISASDRLLQYRIKSGTASKLPQGLQLLNSGDIAGTVSFNTFTLDSGTTTFDSDRATRLEIDPTTFDKDFDFTVEVYSIDGLINSSRTFQITVDRQFNSPYESLYIEAMPDNQDRLLISNLVNSSDLIPPDTVYRPQDPNFGVAKRVKYVHDFGLNTATLQEYVYALQLNHFRKKLVLGEIKSAQATDINGNIIYEVVYSEIVDTGVNQEGDSPPQKVPVPYPFPSNDGSTEVDYVYPNSLINMRNQVVSVIGQDNLILPLWMKSQQADGSVLGFTKAWVIAYVKPGYGNQVAYNIKTDFGQILNRVNWIADRYIIDRSQTVNWVVNPDSTDGGNWYPHPALSTTFNVNQTTNPTVSGNPTIFDGNKTDFAKPVDVYNPGDQYNQYVLYPKINILE